MARLLVAYGAGEVSTGEIALTIAEQLTRCGFAVDLKRCGRAPRAGDYAGVVLGSACTPTWEPDATAYLAANLPELVPSRTRLFGWLPRGTGPGDDGTLLALLDAAGLTPPTVLPTPGGPWCPAVAPRFGSGPPFWRDRARWLEVRLWAEQFAVDLQQALLPSA